MKHFALIISGSIIAASCGGGIASPSPERPALPVGSVDSQNLKGGRPDTSGDWLLPVTFTSVSTGCGGEPAVGSTFTEQIAVTQQGSAVQWQVTSETERYEGKLQGNGSFVVSGLAAADTEGQQFVGNADSAGTTMSGQFTYSSATCAIEGTFAARRP